MRDNETANITDGNIYHVPHHKDFKLIMLYISKC